MLRFHAEKTGQEKRRHRLNEKSKAHDEQQQSQERRVAGADHVVDEVLGAGRQYHARQPVDQHQNQPERHLEPMGPDDLLAAILLGERGSYRKAVTKGRQLFAELISSKRARTALDRQFASNVFLRPRSVS